MALVFNFVEIGEPNISQKSSQSFNLSLFFKEMVELRALFTFRLQQLSHILVDHDALRLRTFETIEIVS